MTAPTVTAKGRSAWVDGYAVRFTARGFLCVEPSFANIEADARGRAHGVLVELTDDEWRRIAAHEDGYEAVRVTACTAEGSWDDCVTLTATPRERAAERAPSARYARILARGASLHGLPSDVIARYEALARTGSRLSSRLDVLRAPMLFLTRLLGARGAAAVVLATSAIAVAAAVYGLMRASTP